MEMEERLGMGAMSGCIAVGNRYSRSDTTSKETGQMRQVVCPSIVGNPDGQVSTVAVLLRRYGEPLCVPSGGK